MRWRTWGISSRSTPMAGFIASSGTADTPRTHIHFGKLKINP
jgi:hypothetical protein